MVSKSKPKFVKQSWFATTVPILWQYGLYMGASIIGPSWLYPFQLCKKYNKHNASMMPVAAFCWCWYQPNNTTWTAIPFLLNLLIQCMGCFLLWYCQQLPSININHSNSYLHITLNTYIIDLLIAPYIVISIFSYIQTWWIFLSVLVLIITCQS